MCFHETQEALQLNQPVPLRQIRRVVIPEKITLNMNGLAPKLKILPSLHRPLKSRTFPQLSHPDALDRQ